MKMDNVPQKKFYNQRKKIHRHSSNFNNFDTSRIIKRNKKTFDGYRNAMSGFGGTYDPMNKLTYNVSPVLDKATIELLYRQDWLSRKIVETIPDDITRKWIDIHMPNEELVLEVQEKIRKLNAIVKIKEAMINARLYGGAVILLGIVNGQPQYKPLDYNNIDDVLYLNVVDKTNLNVHSYYKDPFKPKYAEPELYRLNTRLKPDDYDFNNYLVHETRLLRFDGAYLPEFTRHVNQGWSDSVLNSMNQALKQYGTSIQAGALLFQDFISKTLKMPNLSELLQSDDGQRALELRLQYAIANFSSIGIVLLGENEEFNKIQTPITGLPELIDKYIQIGSAASSIPRARLFGQSLGTLAGATETTRAYYDFLCGYQIDHLQPPLTTFIKILLNRKNSSTKGIEPEQWNFKFNSLWDATDKEVTTARKMQAQVDDMYIKNKTITPIEVGKSRFRPDGYSFDTIINFNNREGEFYQESIPLLESPKKEENDTKNINNIDK